MARRRGGSPIPRWLSGLFAGVAMMAAVTGFIALLKSHIPPVYLLPLYLLVVLPVAVVWGTRLAVVIAVLCVATYVYVVVPPPVMTWVLRLPTWS